MNNYLLARPLNTVRLFVAPLLAVEPVEDASLKGFDRLSSNGLPGIIRARLIAWMTFLLIFSAGIADADPLASEAKQQVVYDNYETFYQSRQSSLFSNADNKRLVKTNVSAKPNLIVWKGRLETNGKLHEVYLDGADILIDGRRFAASHALPFAEEHLATALGRRATLYANAEYLCIEGVAPSASGTAQRHVQVSLIEQPFSRQGAKRYELPSLFGSCLNLYRGSQHDVKFFKANLEWPQDQEQPVAVIFTEYEMSAGQFKTTGLLMRGQFAESGDVYRFIVTNP